MIRVRAAWQSGSKLLNSCWSDHLLKHCTVSYTYISSRILHGEKSKFCKQQWKILQAFIANNFIFHYKQSINYPYSGQCETSKTILNRDHNLFVLACTERWIFTSVISLSHVLLLILYYLILSLYSISRSWICLTALRLRHSCPCLLLQTFKCCNKERQRDTWWIQKGTSYVLSMWGCRAWTIF